MVQERQVRQQAMPNDPRIQEPKGVPAQRQNCSSVRRSVLSNVPVAAVDEKC